jgi:hypothetical protein
MRLIAAILLLVATTSHDVTAFSKSHSALWTRGSSRDSAFSNSRQLAFFNSGEYDHYDDHRHHHDALAHNRRRTDPLIFLTQRSIQSFFYLLASTRDPHTIKWIEVSRV